MDREGINPLLDKGYWEERYSLGNTPWDVGHHTQIIEEIVVAYPDKQTYILIPGCGSGYEALYLKNNGYKNVTLLDISPTAIDNAKKVIGEIPDTWSIVEGDFFEYKGNHQVIFEQTFFCALPFDLRDGYAKKVYEILTTNGKLIGLLFNFDFNSPNPPYGGNIEEYQILFSKLFREVSIIPYLDSIPPRLGKEVRIELLK